MAFPLSAPAMLPVKKLLKNLKILKLFLFCFQYYQQYAQQFSQQQAAQQQQYAAAWNAWQQSQQWKTNEQNKILLITSSKNMLLITGAKLSWFLSLQSVVNYRVKWVFSASETYTTTPQPPPQSPPYFKSLQKWCVFFGSTYKKSLNEDVWCRSKFHQVQQRVKVKENGGTYEIFFCQDFKMF